MEIITYICIAVAVVAAIDRIFGSRLGLGTEFEKGIETIGPLTLSMAGMIVVAPFIAQLLGKCSGIFPSFIDFSIVPSCFLANDMGGAHLASQLANTPEIGYFNGLVVASMMGCTCSFTIPFAMQITDKSRHGDVIFGILCGMLTMPVGCVVGGLVAGLSIVTLLTNLIPLFVFVALVAVGILKFERITIAIFKGFSLVIKAIITFGLVVGLIEFLTDFRVLPQMDTLDSALEIILNIVCIMAGVYPLLHVVQKLLRQVFERMGKKLGINQIAAFSFLATAGNNIATFKAANEMDEKGLVLNAAFAVSGSFVFVDHLAFTLSYQDRFVPAVVVGKLVAAVLAVVVANLLYKRKHKAA